MRDAVIGVAAWLAVVVAVVALCRQAAQGDDGLVAIARALQRGGDPDSPELAGEAPRSNGVVKQLRWVRLPRTR
jgi:hypothetical protein